MSRRKSDTRRTEQLIALWHYEMDGRGCSIHEELPGVFELVTEALTSISPGDADMTMAELERANRHALAIADRILIALIECGYGEMVEEHIEATAAGRRECDARSGAPRDIPFDRREWEGLLKKVGRLDEYGMIRTGAVAP